MTSKLPPELWLTIFHHATHVPGTLVPDIYVLTSLTGSAYSKCANAALRDALVTKRALVRVCKRWWHLAISVLYGSVYVGRARCLSSLATTLVRSAAREGTLVGERPLGEYTQRLDLVIRDHVGADFDSLCTLIANMPHLAIVLFVNVPAHYSPVIPKHILDALRHSATSLRVLDFRASRLEPPVGSAAILLAECTQLRVLSCPRLLWSGDFRHIAIPPTVTTLRLRGVIPIPIDFVRVMLREISSTAPPYAEPSALQELILDLNLDINHWKDVLQVYSPQLVSVQFYIPSLTMIDVHGHLQLLIQTCPSLRRLILTSECFSSFTRPHLVFPPITYLGLRILRSQAPKVDFEKFFVLLAELRSSVPSLRVVQLLNEPNVQCLVRTHAKFAVRALQSFGEGASIRVEDREGVLLTGSRLFAPWFRSG